jgi:hypothetical protein
MKLYTVKIETITPTGGRLKSFGVKANNMREARVMAEEMCEEGYDVVYVGIPKPKLL